MTSKLKKMSDHHYLVFDVESIGLHGEGFAVAGGVFLGNGACQYGFSFSCPPEKAEGNDSDRKWVDENICVMTETHRTPKAVRDAFWNEWLKAKARYPEIIMAAECGWPVEAKFLESCVMDDIEKRNWEGPYPLLEIASIMLAAGMDPMAEYERKGNETPKHHPLADANQSARLLCEAISAIQRATGGNEG